MTTTMISPLAYIDPAAKIGQNVKIHPFAYIDKNVEIGDGCEIMSNASILSGARLGKNNRVFQGAVIAAEPQDFDYTGEESLCIVGDHNFIMTGARLSHDVKVGNHCIIGNGSQVSGNCQIEDCAILTSNVLMQGGTRLGTYSAVQGGCRFTKDIPPYIVAAHDPIEFYSINTIVLQRAHFSETLVKHIAQAYRILYKANTSQHDALLRIREQIPGGPEIEHIVRFVESSRLGIIH